MRFFACVFGFICFIIIDVLYVVCFIGQIHGLLNVIDTCTAYIQTQNPENRDRNRFNKKNLN